LPTTVTLEVAAASDIAAVAALFARSRAARLAFLPILHTAEEDRAYFTSQLTEGRMTLACDGATVVGFMVEGDGWVEHLYLDAGRFGQGVGAILLGAAQSRQRRLQLWCYAENTAALAFYGKKGFVEMRRTDGENEAGLPDVLREWKHT
jgi:putative acetyltransferase